MAASVHVAARSFPIEVRHTALQRPFSCSTIVGAIHSLRVQSLQPRRGAESRATSIRGQAVSDQRGRACPAFRTAGRWWAHRSGAHRESTSKTCPRGEELLPSRGGERGGEEGTSRAGFCKKPAVRSGGTAHGPPLKLKGSLEHAKHLIPGIAMTFVARMSTSSEVCRMVAKGSAGPRMNGWCLADGCWRKKKSWASEAQCCIPPLMKCTYADYNEHIASPPCRPVTVRISTNAYHRQARFLSASIQAHRIASGKRKRQGARAVRSLCSCGSTQGRDAQGRTGGSSS